MLINKHANIKISKSTEQTDINYARCYLRRARYGSGTPVLQLIATASLLFVYPLR